MDPRRHQHQPPSNWAGTSYGDSNSFRAPPPYQGPPNDRPPRANFDPRREAQYRPQSHGGPPPPRDAQPDARGSRRSDSGNSSIFVGGLPTYYDDNALAEQLQRFGPVREARVQRDTQGLSRGFGMVDFVNSDSALQALNSKVSKQTQIPQK